MLHAWVFGRVIITVGYWEQIGAETESGSRVEVRRVEPEPVPGAAAGVAGFRVLDVGSGIWRADLFTGPDGPIYHYHPAFEHGDVGQRFLDPELTASPVDWAIDRLSDIQGLLSGSGQPTWWTTSHRPSSICCCRPSAWRSSARSSPWRRQVGRAG